MALEHTSFIYSIIKVFTKKHISFELRVSFFIYNTISCKIILKEDVYRHHYLSMILAIIGLIFISIPIFEKIFCNIAF